MANFAEALPEFLHAGIAAFPVRTRDKKPAVRGWQNATPHSSRRWAATPRLATCEGTGVNMGTASGITEIDVDQAGPAALAQAVEHFGESKVVIQTASGKYKMWFRHNGEGRIIRPISGVEIDVLGAGFTISPPSERGDLGTAYKFIRGGLDDLAHLPNIRTDALESAAAPEAVRNGERNNRLWRWCMTEARHSDDIETLIDAALTYSQAFPDPLLPREVEKTARLAWRYEANGRNFVGLGKPAVTLLDRKMDDLIATPDAFALLQYFERYHAIKDDFRIAPSAMAAAGSPPWSRHRIERARDVLLERGYLVELKPPVRGKRPGLYKLAFHR